MTIWMWGTLYLLGAAAMFPVTHKAYRVDEAKGPDRYRDIAFVLLVLAWPLSAGAVLSGAVKGFIKKYGGRG